MFPDVAEICYTLFIILGKKATAAIATVALYEKTLLPSWPAPAKPAKCLLKVDAHGHSDPSQTFHTAWDLPA